MANVSTGKLKMQKGAATMENTLQFLKRQTVTTYLSDYPPRRQENECPA